MLHVHILMNVISRGLDYHFQPSNCYVLVRIPNSKHLSCFATKSALLI